MPRYIDAEEFIENIKIENTNLIMDGLKGTPLRMALSAKDVIERINIISTADVQEVIHAHWTNKRTQFHDGETYCSHCNAELPYVLISMSSLDDPYPKIEYIDKPNYCPNCGARMDDEQ